MPTILFCNQCGKKYRLKDAPPAGKELHCKECKGGVLVVGEDDAAADEGHTAVPAAAHAAPAAPAVATKPKTDAARQAMDAGADTELVRQIGVSYADMKREIGKKIIGQHEVVERVLVCIFAGGHTLLIGVPGLAKTLLVNSIAQALGVDFKRIQFTPDLMPTDITGTDIIQDDPDTGARHYKFMPGPVFTNILLADEINRTPPKTQAALLEAMQERQVSIGGKVYTLAKPFFVMATQNPLDQEGTYPLPEAQMDRFLFNIFVDYPDREDEIEIARTVTSGVGEEIVSCVSAEQIIDYQKLIKRAPVSEHVLNYAVDLVRATRVKEPGAPDFVKDYINCSAGPRACLALISAGKARAILNGRYHVSVEDIASIANPVLRHRISPNFGAQAEGITSDKLIDMLLKHMPKN